MGKRRASRNRERRLRAENARLRAENARMRELGAELLELCRHWRHVLSQWHQKILAMDLAEMAKRPRGRPIKDEVGARRIRQLNAEPETQRRREVLSKTRKALKERK